MSEPATQRDWSRFHPLSPVLRGGIVLVAVVGYLLSQFVERLTRGIGDTPAPEPESRGGEGVEVDVVAHPWVAAGIVLLVLLAVVGAAAASWWFSRYRLGGSTLELRTGAVFRQHRQVPYARIQAVSTTRPLLARLMGLAEVRVESAGGSDSHVSLAYLTHPDAALLRDELLGLAGAAGAPAAGGGDGPEPRDGAREGAPPEAPPAGAAGSSGPPLIDMPFGRLLASTLLSPGAIFVVLLVLAAAVLVVLGQGAAFTGLAVPVFFATVGRVKHLLRWANLTVRRVGDSLAAEHGLTDLATSTVPVRRVQAIEVEQPWMWRRAGWWRLKVNVAGVKLGSDDVVDVGVLVPVGTTAEVRAFVEALTPGLDTTTVHELMIGRMPQGALVSPRSARWLDPLTWRRNGVVLDAEVVAVRRGWLGRVVQVVPHGRIQSMTLAQGPFERRLGVARVSFVSTVGAVSPRTQPLATVEAERVLADEQGRATAARSARAAVGGCDSARDSVDLTAMRTHDDERTAPVTGETATAVGRLGLTHGQVVQEYGWDDDVDEELRTAIEQTVGSVLEDEDYTGVADVALLWWRDGDGDLTDALVDTLGTLEDGGGIVLLTPRPGQEDEVDPAEVDEAATTAGLHTSGSTMCSETWVATRLAARKTAR